MDNLVLQHYLQADSNDDNDFEYTLTATIAGVLFCCIEDARQKYAACRQFHRAYLCRPQLLPNPRVDTPWQRLYASQNDRAFIVTMGVDVYTFHYILEGGFQYLWDTTPIPHNDTSLSGDPRIGARSLDAAGALGLYLHWVSSTMRETSLQEVFALIPSTVNRYLHFAEALLHAALKELPEAQVSWPMENGKFEEYSKLVQVRV